jgi:hypothetical protein
LTRGFGPIFLGDGGNIGDILSDGGQVRTVSPVDVKVVGGLKSLEKKPSVLYPASALPGKLSGPYTKLSTAFEKVPNIASKPVPKTMAGINFQNDFLRRWIFHEGRFSTREFVIRAFGLPRDQRPGQTEHPGKGRCRRPEHELLAH